MAGWYHWCNGHDLGQTLGDAEGQGDLAHCNSWGHKESDMIEWLKNNKRFFESLTSKSLSCCFWVLGYCIMYPILINLSLLIKKPALNQASNLQKILTSLCPLPDTVKFLWSIFSLPTVRSKLSFGLSRDWVCNV